MRVLVASLGFSYHHVMAVANRCRPEKIVLATVNPEVDRVKNAVDEVALYGKALGIAVEVEKLDPSDFWQCVGEAARLFAGDDEYFLDVGGGVRALSLCLFTAALLAVYILDAKLRAVYTMAEHSERVVEVDLRPVLYVRSLRDSRSSAKRSFLAELASAGEAELGRYEKRLLREFAEYGLSDGTSLTSAGVAFSKILSLWEARRLQPRRLPRR